MGEGREGWRRRGLLVSWLGVGRFGGCGWFGGEVRRRNTTDRGTLCAWECEYEGGEGRGGVEGGVEGWREGREGRTEEGREDEREAKDDGVDENDAGDYLVVCASGGDGQGDVAPHVLDGKVFHRPFNDSKHCGGGGEGKGRRVAAMRRRCRAGGGVMKRGV